MICLGVVHGNRSRWCRVCAVDILYIWNVEPVYIRKRSKNFTRARAVRVVYSRFAVTPRGPQKPQQIVATTSRLGIKTETINPFPAVPVQCAACPLYRWRDENCQVVSGESVYFISGAAGANDEQQINGLVSYRPV